MDMGPEVGAAIEAEGRDGEGAPLLYTLDTPSAAP